MLAKQLLHFYSGFSVLYKSFLPSQRYFTGIFFLMKSPLQRVCGAAELLYEDDITSWP